MARHPQPTQRKGTFAVIQRVAGSSMGWLPMVTSRGIERPRRRNASELSASESEVVLGAAAAALQRLRMACRLRMRPKGWARTPVATVWAVTERRTHAVCAHHLFPRPPGGPRLPGETTLSLEWIACGRPRHRNIASTFISIDCAGNFVSTLVILYSEPFGAITENLLDMTFGALALSVEVTPRRYRLSTSLTWLERAWLTWKAAPRRVYLFVAYRNIVDELCMRWKL
jgi:hypothetical protein